MRSWIARRMLRATSKRHRYDTSYLAIPRRPLRLGEFQNKLNDRDHGALTSAWRAAWAAAVH